MVSFCSDGDACVRIYCVTVPCSRALDDLAHLDAHRSADLAFSLLCLLCLVRAVLLLLTPAATRYARARLHAPTDLLLVLVALSLLVPRLHRGEGLALGAHHHEAEEVAAMLRRGPAPRVVLCLFGVIERSINRTWPTIHDRLVLPLRDHGVPVDLYVFDMDVHMHVPVDGRWIDAAQHDAAVRLLQPARLQGVQQRIAERELRSHCGGTNLSKCAFQNYELGSKDHRNALLQLYSERAVGRFLLTELDAYDVAVVCGPDFYLALNISVADVLRAAASTSLFFTTQVNPAHGLTNGFYIGSTVAVSKAMRRLDEPRLWTTPLPVRDYEEHLRHAVDLHRLDSRPTTMVFFKVRKTGSVHWQGGKGTGHLGEPQDRAAVRAAYEVAQGLHVADGGCATLSPTPVDSAPIRSPQAVHSALAYRFAGHDVVEIGTRNGDGIDCFAQVARSARAIELSKPYCEKLRSRASALGAMGKRSFSVSCSGYEQASLDADFITWWQQPPLTDERALRHLRAEQLPGRIRDGAVAVVLFDLSWHEDRASLLRLRPLATWSEEVSFDERALCEVKLAAAPPSEREGGWKCSRAVGKFVVLGIPLTRVPGAPPRGLTALASFG